MFYINTATPAPINILLGSKHDSTSDSTRAAGVSYHKVPNYCRL